MRVESIASNETKGLAAGKIKDKKKKSLLGQAHLQKIINQWMDLLLSFWQILQSLLFGFNSLFKREASLHCCRSAAEISLGHVR